eukprot:9472735-Pyramimonas_sp.AAC.1
MRDQRKLIAHPALALHPGGDDMSSTSSTSSQRDTGNPRPHPRSGQRASGMSRVASTGTSDHYHAAPFIAIQPARRIRHLLPQGSHDLAPDQLRLEVA